MFFTNAGRTVAWFCIVASVLHLGYLQIFAFKQGGIMPDHPLWDSLVSAFKKDVQMFIGGVAIGILTEISSSLASLKRIEKVYPGDVENGL